jgi:hypothetical protein
VDQRLRKPREVHEHLFAAGEEKALRDGLVRGRADGNCRVGHGIRVGVAPTVRVAFFVLDVVFEAFRDGWCNI